MCLERADRPIRRSTRTLQPATQRDERGADSLGLDDGDDFAEAPGCGGLGGRTDFLILVWDFWALWAAMVVLVVFRGYGLFWGTS